MENSVPGWEGWERQRSKGRQHYFWRFGVCYFGLSWGLLMGVFAFLFTFSTSLPLAFFAAVLCVLVGLPTGFLWALCMWVDMERAYLAAQKEHEQKAVIDALTTEVRHLRETMEKSKEDRITK